MLLAAFRNLVLGRCLAAPALTFLLTPALLPALHQQADQFRLKAAFVYRFPQFVTWPADAWARRDDVEVCVVQPDPFGAILPDLLRGEAINGRPLRLRLMVPEQREDSCHVVVIAGADAVRDSSDLLKRLAGRPVLTIGDDPSFLAQGGIIALKIVDNRVRFEVSVTNARRAGLQVSAQLLRLALAVHGGQP